MVPSTMSPSLKYLMVASIAARKSSAEPMSLTATCGVPWALPLLLLTAGAGGASMLLVIGEWTPMDGWGRAGARAT